MTPPPIHASLGDSHNFGRRVSLVDGRVHKPRTLTWERLLLSRASPLRQLLDTHAARDALGAEAFGFLPDLQFGPDRGHLGGEVEQVSLSPLGPDVALSEAERQDLARITGRAIALFAWLGVSDLHWENLMLGRDVRGAIVFGPLDVEDLLAPFALPTGTKLIPDPGPELAVICQHAAGVRRVLPYLGKPIATRDLIEIAAGYHETLAFLGRHARAIAEVFTGLPDLHSAPIRVCLRGTEDYVLAGARPLWPPLLDAERAQLDRGDIPYFFRRYGQRGIFHFTDAALTIAERLPMRGDVPKLLPLLSLSRGLSEPSRRSLAEEGLIAVIGAFDHPALTGTHSAGEITLTLRPRKMIVRLANGEELEARRDLRDLVSSVYLPCTCGEVRTVLVPSVTQCTEE